MSYNRLQPPTGHRQVWHAAFEHIKRAPLWACSGDPVGLVHWQKAPKMAAVASPDKNVHQALAARGLTPNNAGSPPTVYLMEAADDICYALIDLEDGLEMELLDYPEVESLLLNLVGDDLPETYRLLGTGDSRRRKLAILRGKAIEHLTNAAAQAFVEQQILLAGTLNGDLVRNNMHGPAKRCVLNAKDMARKKIFQDKRKTLHEVGAYTTLEILLNSFCGAALEQHGGRTPSFKHRRILDLLGNNAPDPHWPYTNPSAP
ncbi:hypothetical protein FQR65_LT20155 [Abscondita terminalis]|nr:hypothetical protein FQR65_LT20155 [Abscondita terminalis]